MIDTEGLDQLIDDARHMSLPRPRTDSPADAATPAREVRLPESRREIRIPAASVTLLEDWELYVD